MSEKEIRNIVRTICADLDERAIRATQARIRKVVLPAALGISLVVAGCSSDSNSRKDGLQNVDGGYDATTNPSNKEGGEPDAGPVAEYAAPMTDAGTSGQHDASVDTGPVPPYMAYIPDSSTDGGGSGDAQNQDAGQQVDAGPVAEYMAIIDSGPALLYMAVFVDSGK
jgi:hypothetical protein